MQTVPDSFANRYPYFQPGFKNFLPMLLFRRPIKLLLIFFLLLFSSQEHVLAAFTFSPFFRYNKIISPKTAVAFWGWSSPETKVSLNVTYCQLYTTSYFQMKTITMTIKPPWKFSLFKISFK